MFNRELSEYRLAEIKRDLRRQFTGLVIRANNLEIINPNGEMIHFFEFLKPLKNSQEKDLAHMIQDVSDKVISAELELESPYPNPSKELAIKLAMIISSDSRLTRAHTADNFKKLLIFINPTANWDISEITFPHYDNQ